MSQVTDVSIESDSIDNNNESTKTLQISFYAPQCVCVSLCTDKERKEDDFHTELGRAFYAKDLLVFLRTAATLLEEALRQSNEHKE